MENMTRFLTRRNKRSNGGRGSISSDFQIHAEKVWNVRNGLGFIPSGRPIEKIERNASSDSDQHSHTNARGETEGTHEDLIQERDDDRRRHGQSQCHHVTTQIDGFAGFPHIRDIQPEAEKLLSHWSIDLNDATGWIVNKMLPVIQGMVKSWKWNDDRQAVSV